MTARPQDIPEDVVPFYDAIADRLLWMLDEGDAAVVPGPVKEEFVAYLCDVLGVPAETISVSSLRANGVADWYPGHHTDLITNLRKVIDGNRSAEWTVECYIRDREIIAWETELSARGRAASTFAQGIAELMNTKSVFRNLAQAAGAPIAEGRVATRGDELIDAVIDLLAKTGAVIVKQDQNSGGDGNALITTDKSIPSIGAYRSLRITRSDSAAVRSALAEAGLHEEVEVPSGCCPAKYVVEVYHPRSRTFYVELHIPEHSAPYLLNYGDMRMSPLWSGFEIPAQGLPAAQHARLCADAQQLAVLAQRVGYHGLINCDAIIDQHGEILFTEFNGRAGGCTHIDIIARRLLGEDYLRNYVLLTQNAVKSPAFSKLLTLLADASLLFCRDRRAGIIVAQDNTAVTGTIEYIAIGRDHDEALDYEHRLQVALDNANKLVTV
ncbi:peptide ligase PGM1-related protein [Nocardia terpenica]|nr:peptide ligase PGM1-related protein [Nocardia terpenica]NQE90861.1 hypothetical protein [Nocardia terpenica]